MTVITDIGSFVPGVVYSNGPGSFSSIPSPGAGYYLASNGANSYVFTKNFAASQISYGVTNASFIALTGGSPAPAITAPVGDNSSNYDAAAQVLSTTWGAASPLSLVSITSSATCSVANSTAYINIYADPPQIPAPESSGNSVAMDYPSGVIVAPTVTGFTYGNIGFVVPITSSACVFTSTASSVSAGYPGDFLLVEELVPLNSNNVSTATCTSTSATPVTLFTITTDGSLDAYFCTGTVVFGDTAFLNSNSASFMFLLQQGTTGGPIVSVGPSSSLSAAPYLSYSIASNTLTVSVVGIASSTFDCKATYTVIEGIGSV